MWSVFILQRDAVTPTRADGIHSTRLDAHGRSGARSNKTRGHSGLQRLFESSFSFSALLSSLFKLHIHRSFGDKASASLKRFKQTLLNLLGLQFWRFAIEHIDRLEPIFQHANCAVEHALKKHTDKDDPDKKKTVQRSVCPQCTPEDDS